jgi:hypothetical protein
MKAIRKANDAEKEARKAADEAEEAATSNSIRRRFIDAGVPNYFRNVTRMVRYIDYAFRH